VTSDDQNCGACGTVCSDQDSCSAGKCQPRCPSGHSYCQYTCVNTQRDNSNCGDCGTVCSGGSYCHAGSCTCRSKDQTVCGGVCAYLKSDRFNCGTCGNACTKYGYSCQLGVCVWTGG
jgi:hypothetical protein